MKLKTDGSSRTIAPMSWAKVVAATAAAAFVSLVLAACSSSAGSDTGDGLSGTVSTNGSTSMEQVVGCLAEAFMGENPGVTVTYDATGSGTGIELMVTV